MAFSSIEVMATGIDAGYSAEQQAQFEGFIQGFDRVATLNSLLHPAYEENSLWTDGALTGLRGVDGLAMPNPQMGPHYLQGTGHEHFRSFCEQVVGAVSEPRTDIPARVAYVPAGILLDMPGLPGNVQELMWSENVDTVVAAVSFPYKQEPVDMPDFPSEALERLGRESFGVIPYEEGTVWDVDVLFGVHFVHGLSVGRIGLAHNGPDVPMTIYNQVKNQRTANIELWTPPALSPDAVAHVLNRFATRA